MEGDVAQLDPADYDSLLPPRKRLLAGLKRQNSDFSLPLFFTSDELRARFQGLLNSNDLSPEEIVEAAKAEALAASRAAAAARAIAAETAIAAANARAFAKSVLEMVAASAERDENSIKKHPKKKRTKKEYVPIERDENSKKNQPKTKKTKKTKKHVSVELLYKSGCPVQTSENDEELARRLHRSMNSSPRVSTRVNKKSEAVRATRNSDGVAACNGNPTSPVDDSVEPSDGNCEEKFGGRVARGSRVECTGKVAAASEVLGNHKSVTVGKGVVHGKRGRSKQKKRPLSQCCMRDEANSREMPPLEDHPPTGEPKDDATEDMHAPARRPSKEEHAPLEAKPLWKCKKFRLSRCHPEGKHLHSQCSIPTLTTTSALVKVD